MQNASVVEVPLEQVLDVEVGTFPVGADSVTKVTARGGPARAVLGLGGLVHALMPSLPSLPRQLAASCWEENVGCDFGHTAPEVPTPDTCLCCSAMRYAVCCAGYAAAGRWQEACAHLWAQGEGGKAAAPIHSGERGGYKGCMSFSALCFAFGRSQKQAPQHQIFLHHRLPSFGCPTPTSVCSPPSCSSQR